LGLNFNPEQFIRGKYSEKKIHFYQLYINFSFFTTQKIRVFHPGVVLFSKIAFNSKKSKKIKKFAKIAKFAFVY